MTVLTDGRKKYIEEALPPWIMHYGDQVDYRYIIDDSGDPDYRLWLENTFQDFTVVPVDLDRAGFANAMRKVFATVRASGSDYNLHVEDDFVLKRPFNLQDVVDTLAINPDVSQMSFMREPWYENEIKYGGVIQAIEAENELKLREKGVGRLSWTQHLAYWTCNPSVFPSWVAQRPWPNDPWCEMYFSRDMKRDRKFSGIWGHRSDWIYLDHIGRERAGHGY